MRYSPKGRVARTLIEMVAAVSVAACAVAGTEPVQRASSDLRTSRTSGSAQYSFALTGDLNSLTTQAGTQVTSGMSASAPFQSLTLKGVQLTVGDAGSGPTGDIAACQANASALSYSTDWNGNDGRWNGTLTVSGVSYVKFSGTRVSTSGVTEQLQFTVNFGTSISTDPVTGVATLTYRNSTLFFGSASTHFDASHYRCVNFTMTATP